MMDRLTTDKRYICIEGNIGAGKSSLAEALSTDKTAARVLGDHVIWQPEPAEGRNPYLDLYYADPARYALPMQIYLLSQRRRSQMAAQALCLSGVASVIADRSYFGDRCFAEIQRDLGYFSEVDFSTYLSLHKDMQAELLYPSAFIWISTSPELCLQRIARRRSAIAGRKCEAGISLEYLQRLDKSITRMMSAMDRYTPVLELSATYEDGTERPLSALCSIIADWLYGLDVPYDSWQGIG